MTSAQKGGDAVLDEDKVVGVAGVVAIVEASSRSITSSCCCLSKS